MRTSQVTIHSNSAIAKPRVENWDLWMRTKALFWMIVEITLWALLFLSAIHVGVFYIQSIFFSTIQETVSVKYATYVAIGAFFCLIVHGSQLWKRAGYDRNPSIQSCTPIETK